MTDRYAPPAKVWMCAMCGKKTKDLWGCEGGWDESCALNAYLIDDETAERGPAASAPAKPSTSTTMSTHDAFPTSMNTNHATQNPTPPAPSPSPSPQPGQETEQQRRQREQQQQGA